MNMNKRLYIPVILVILLSACGHEEKDTTAVVSKDSTKISVQNDIVQLSVTQRENAGITTGTPERREMHTTIKVSGVVDVPPQNIVSVSMPLGGYLKSTSLIPGTRVSKSSILATLEDPQYIQLQQDYLTAKSRLVFLEADYGRQKGLNETKATSDKTLQQVQSEYNSQRILLRSLAEKLRLIGIRPESLSENNISRTIHLYAPISGYVSKVNVNIGKYVAPTDVLFELINPEDLHISLTVFENDATRLTKGQTVSFTTNNQPGEVYTAKVHMIAPSIAEDRTTVVHCHMDQNSRKLLPGTFVNATIQLGNTQVTAVPEDAVVKWENKFYLFSEQTNGSYKLVPVETGTSGDGYTEIRSEIPAGNIVTKSAYTLLMKMKNSSEEG